MTTRTTLAVPIDVVRTFDHTASQTQIQNNVFQGTPDDRDMLFSLIEDAEDEFRAEAGGDMRLSRAGTPGQRETFDQITYKTPGHETYKQSWTGVGGDYLNQEVTKDLGNDRILPFDPAEGDEAYFYRGLSGNLTSGAQWEDVTDEVGELWAIVDHRSGTVAFHPLEIDRAILGSSSGLMQSRQDELRFAISYRYGALGGSRSGAGATTLSASITDSETGTVAVTDASRLPGAGSGGSYVFLIDQEYVSATVNTSNDEIEIETRGVRGTNAASHDADARIQYTPPAVRKAVANRAGMGLIQSGRYKSFMPDSEDSVDKNDMLTRMKETWDATIEAMS